MKKKRAMKHVSKTATRRTTKARRIVRRTARKPAAKKTSVRKFSRKRKVAAVKRPAKRTTKPAKRRVIATRRRRVTKAKVVRGKRIPATKKISLAAAKPVFVRIKPFELRGLLNVAAQPAFAQPKTPAHAIRVEVPRILLEGDHAELPLAPRVLGKKFALGAAAGESAPAQPQTQLPAGYGSGTIHATARDPHWLYVNWDFTREQQMRFNTQSAQGHLVLRVLADELKRPVAAEVHVHPESRHWFVHVERADARCVAQLGFYDKRKSWHTVATAVPVQMPGKKNSEPGKIKFATIHPDQPFAEIQGRAERSGFGELALTEALERLRATEQSGSSADEAALVELAAESVAIFFPTESGQEISSSAWSSIDWALTGS